MLGAEVALARRGVTLDDVEIAGGRFGPEAGGAAPLRMVWLGDSTAAGVGASQSDRSVPALVAAAQTRPVDLVVLARSGARVGEVVASQVPRLGGLQPDVVLISIGANDATHLTTRDDFRTTYERLLDAMPKDARIVVLGVPDMGAPPRLPQPLRALNGWRGRRLDAVVRALARRHDADYVPIAARTGPAFRRDHALFAADGYHPDDAGYRLWADAVLDVLGSDGEGRRS